MSENREIIENIAAERTADAHNYDDQAHSRAGNQHLQQKSMSRNNVLTIRCHTGIAGDILLTGLAILHLRKLDIEPQSAEAQEWLKNIFSRVLPRLSGCGRIIRAEVNGVNGWRLDLNLPHSHEHRNLEDIKKIIAEAEISEAAKERSFNCFEMLGRCEAAVHNIDINEIHFHEVGALDSILDICVSCEIFETLGIKNMVCGPLPMADGGINCAHGMLPAPAPAVLQLLRDIPVCPFKGERDAGELVTPTGIALLRAFDCKFGSWPRFTLRNAEIVYGQKIFPNAPNGVIFAAGDSGPD